MTRATKTARSHSRKIDRTASVFRWLTQHGPGMDHDSAIRLMRKHSALIEGTIGDALAVARAMLCAEDPEVFAVYLVPAQLAAFRAAVEDVPGGEDVSKYTAGEWR